MSFSDSDRGGIPRPSTYAGVFLTTLSLLQLELFLTRIFSVTMWYHFAFMAISLAMFGLAVGAVFVELAKKKNAYLSLERASLGFSISSVICFALELQISVDPSQRLGMTALAFLLVAIPFVFAGVVVCVALTRFPAYTGGLYAADLAGSAVGCVLAIPILNSIHAPSAVILNAAIAMLGVSAFSAGTRRAKYAGFAAVALGVLAAVNVSARVVDVRWIKGGGAGHALYEKWNALSRIAISQFSTTPFGWGMSPNYKPTKELDQLYLNIDSGAATVITKFSGNLADVEHLKYDVTALAHYLRGNASVLVIGVGGGRDVLTSLAFDQSRVVGVEINPDIIDVVTRRYADYVGNLQSLPSVTITHDEARSYIERSSEQFGIIQASLIDTWAASSAGAYVLTENGLYTREAWRVFLNHLTPDGILTMSRWYDESQPAETLRLASLATAALLDAGVEDPRRHMMIVRKKDLETGQTGVATILVCRRPFTEEEIARIVDVSARLDFAPVLTPHFAERADFNAIATRSEYHRFVAEYPLNIEAPTDDVPFFFHMLRASDLLKTSTYQGMNDINLRAVKVLGSLLGIVVALSACAIALPMAIGRRVRDRGSSLSMLYFAAIGLAFMMVEIGQLERLIVFLGHPIYGLTVVLFVLLVSSSLGSLMSGRFAHWIWALPIVLAAFIWGGPVLTEHFVSTSTPLRILISSLMLFPCGLLMGMAFPVGINQANAVDGAPTAWYWAINGALSVVSSVLAVIVAVFWGITATLAVGLAAYVLALGALAAGRRGARGTA